MRSNPKRMPGKPASMAALCVLFFAMTAARAGTVEVMILGTYHLANPGQDLHNVEVDDVTSPERQAQLDRVAEALATFRPDRIAVERTSEREDMSLADYRQFEAEMLENQRSETIQIGYRLARMLGHSDVYGIDERSDEIDYFPYPRVSRYAEEHGRNEVLAELNAGAQYYVRTIGRLHETTTIGRALAWINQPEMIRRGFSNLYYGMLQLADEKQQPGALLNGRYYLRNARIFARLAAIASPGDRILVVIGSGHAYWLRHFVDETPGFRLVEPGPYLEARAE